MNWSDMITGAFQQGLGPPAVVFCLAAIGLNVHFGYTGLLNFGQAGFMAVAAYALASFVATWGLSFWLGIMVGLL
ncbi:MAG: branched-chain amino acid ABC transporter permease, partial [Nocardioidaceae bacterium]